MIRPDANPAGVELVGLTKRYDSKPVVDQLTLDIPFGSTFGLIGPNGAGKSTTLKMLMGMVRIDDGKVVVLGQDIGASYGTKEFYELRQKIGYVPETHHIFRWMRVSQAIQFVSRFYRRWNQKLCDDLIRLFGLAPDKKVKQLSKGMLAKLALLLALCHEPELLVLDEPLSGMDPLSREEFLDGVLRSVCEREMTVIFSSHSLDDVQRIVDSVGLLHQGRLLVNRPVEELLAKTKRVRAVLETDSAPSWFPDSTVCQLVQQREWVLTVDDFSPELAGRLERENSARAVEIQDLNLEEIFKDYVKGQKVTV